MNRKQGYLVKPDCCPNKSSPSSDQHKPLMLIITNFLQYILHRFKLLFQCSPVSDGYRGKLVAVVLQNTFQWLLAAVNEQSPIFGFVLCAPRLSRSCTISAQYTKSFTVEKKRRYSLCLFRKKLMRALSESRVFFSFNLDANSSAESVDKERSQTRLFNYFW